MTSGGHHLVTPEQHVHHRLDADDLGGGRHQRRVAQVLAGLGQVGHDLVDAVQGVGLPKLVHQVGVHAAGDLVQQHAGVDLGHLGGVQEVAVLHRHLLQVLADLDQLGQVHVGLPLGLLHRHHQGLDGRLGGPQGEGGQAGVQHVHARLDGLQVAHGARAGGVVGVELHRDLDGLLDGLDDLVGVVGRDHAGHVLEDEGVGPHLFGLLGEVDVVVEIEDGAAQAPLRQAEKHTAAWKWAMSPAFLASIRALTETSQLRMSFKASKTRKMSTPASAV